MSDNEDQTEPVDVLLIQGDDNFNWEKAWETLCRVSLAGFAGSLVGLGKDKQHRARVAASFAKQRKADATAAAAATKQKRHPRRPPQFAARRPVAVPSQNYVAMWSMSCAMFVVVLESFRRASPTSLLFQLLDDADTDASSTSDDQAETKETTAANIDDSSPRSFEELAQRQAWTSFGDYTLGGTVAGLASAVAQRRQKPLPGFTVFGLATGMGLGVMAGCFQAAIQVGDMYLEEQRKIKELKESEEEENTDSDSNST